MDDIVEASNKLGDNNSVINASENNLLDEVARVLPLAEQPEFDAASRENVSEGNTDTTKKKRRKKIKKKVDVINEIQCSCMRQTETNMQITDQVNGNLGVSDNMSDYHVVNNESEKIPVKDVPVLKLAEHPELDAGLMVNASEGKPGKKKKKKKKKVKKVNILSEVQSMDQMPLNARTTENLADIMEDSDDVIYYNVVSKNLEMNILHKDVAGLPLTEHSNIEAASTEYPLGVSTNTKKIKRRNRKKVNAKNEIQSMDQEMTEYLTETNDRMDQSVQAPEQINCNLVDNESKNNLINKDATVLPLSEHLKLEAGSTNSAFEGNIETDKRKRRKKNKKVKVMNEGQSMGKMEMNTGTAEDIAEIKDQLDGHVKLADNTTHCVCSIVNNESENKFPDKDVPLPLVAEHPRLEALLIKNAPEVNIDKKENVGNEVPTMDNSEMNTMTAESLAQIMVCGKRKRSKKKNKKKNAKAKSEIESMNPADAMYKILLPAEILVAGTDKLLNGIDEVNNDIFAGRGKYATEDRSILSPSMRLASLDEKEEKYPSERLGQDPKIELVAPMRRKLLVLDVNGLLAHIVIPAPKDCRGDIHILRRAIFKRPFCNDFLNFCFQNFDVGIWSSRSKVIIDRVVDYLLGNLKDSLLFCWNMSHATQTRHRTLENIHKPLVFKELRKIWENNSPDSRWKKGDYDESNTLLLDDSPYKALLNPPHTAIFPSSFHYEDKNDKSLGPGGDLRVYLEGLLVCDNVQKYVEQNPFGQGAINETNPSWEFYSGVVHGMTNQSNSNCPSSLPMSS